MWYLKSLFNYSSSKAKRTRLKAEIINCMLHATLPCSEHLLSAQHSMTHFFKCFRKKLASRVNAKTSGIWQTIDNFFKQGKALQFIIAKERFVTNKYLHKYKTLLCKSLFILLSSKRCVESVSAQSLLDSFIQAMNCLSYFKGEECDLYWTYVAPKRPCAAIICHNDELSLSWLDCLLTDSEFFNLISP